MSPTPVIHSARVLPLICATISAAVLAGVGAVLFHYLSDGLFETLFTWVNTRETFAGIPRVVTVPTAGLLLIGLFLQRFPASRIGGVKEVLESLQLHHARVPMERILNVTMGGLVLAVGGSVGPEGPMVQLGALLGSKCGQFFRLTGRELEMLVRAGASAGISAAFRSPAGGVLMTLEMFGGRFNRDLTPVAIAAGLGYLVRITILADPYPFRAATEIEPLPLFSLLVLVPLMGVLAAWTGHFFIGMFNRAKTVLPLRWPLWLRTALGGAIVGAIGIRFPQVLSSGYSTIHQAMHGGISPQLFVLLLLLKMLATSITFGSGAVGGLFAPTLVIGALFGGAFGYGIHAILPWAVPQPELIVLLGMVVMFGSIVKGHWSGLLMVADLSGCYHALLLPGVIAGAISYLMSWELRDQSIFGLSVEPSALPAPVREELVSV